MNRKKGCLLFLIAGIGISWGVYQCQYSYSLWADRHDRPWAYSKETDAPLLVGQWEGSFTDPDGIVKTIFLEVKEPVSDEKRKANAGKKRRKRKGLRYKDKTGFEGLSTVNSRLGEESYEIYGSVEKDNYHNLSFHFRPEDEAKRVLPNFTLLEADSGNWMDNRLTVTLSFAYHKADGSSFSSSSDPRHDKKVIVHLNRKLP